MKVLIFVDWFVPGYKAGGQIQSCANLTLGLKDEVEFYVVTSDRDLGDTQTYTGIVADNWNIYSDKVHVMYLSPGRTKFKSLSSIIQEVKPDCIYLNSMFSLHFTIMVLLACSFNKNKTPRIVLAPRGMLHPGALQFKKAKKRMFLSTFRLFGFHKKITFHATDKAEQEDISRIFGKNATIKYVSDFPSVDQQELLSCSKKPGQLACVFVSRIAPKKNLLFLLDILTLLKEEIHLSIVGPVEDQEYWLRCQQRIEQLPEIIKVKYLGAIPNQNLPEIYRKHHLFILPTYGENFGHVIFESFLNGRPVLLSNQTPWKNLDAEKAGWEHDLNDKEKFVTSLKTAISWDQAKFDEYCYNSWKLAHEYIERSGLKKKYLQLFN